MPDMISASDQAIIAQAIAAGRVTICPPVTFKPVPSKFNMNAALGYYLERRTVAHLKSLGYRAERVSRSGRLTCGDLFGCVDVIAVGAGEVMLVQSTTKTNASARRRKIRQAGLPYPVRLWLWFKDGRRWTFTSEVVLPA